MSYNVFSGTLNPSQSCSVNQSVSHSNVVTDVEQAKLRLEVGQERLRQQHAKELEEKEMDLETIKASTQKKVRFLFMATL